MHGAARPSPRSFIMAEWGVSLWRWVFGAFVASLPGSVSSESVCLKREIWKVFHCELQVSCWRICGQQTVYTNVGLSLFWVSRRQKKLHWWTLFVLLSCCSGFLNMLKTSELSYNQGPLFFIKCFNLLISNQLLVVQAGTCYLSNKASNTASQLFRPLTLNAPSVTCWMFLEARGYLGAPHRPSDVIYITHTQQQVNTHVVKTQPSSQTWTQVIRSIIIMKSCTKQFHLNEPFSLQ